jgi:hypothetical protein
MEPGWPSLTSKGPAEYSCEGSFCSSLASCRIRFTASPAIYVREIPANKMGIIPELFLLCEERVAMVLYGHQLDVRLKQVGGSAADRVVVESRLRVGVISDVVGRFHVTFMSPKLVQVWNY